MGFFDRSWIQIHVKPHGGEGESVSLVNINLIQDGTPSPRVCTSVCLKNRVKCAEMGMFLCGLLKVNEPLKSSKWYDGWIGWCPSRI